MNKYLLAIALAVPTFPLTYLVMGVSRTEVKVDALITSHQEVSDEFFSTLTNLDQRITANTNSIIELEKAITNIEKGATK